MPRLHRPHIPLSVRCKIAERQILQRGRPTVSFFTVPIGTLGVRLKALLDLLALQLGCQISDLRLDHDPALGARQKVFKNGKHVEYIPAANDPESLRYRPHGPEYSGSHLIKTNIRGDHGQHPDRVLIKKQRRLENGTVKKKRGNLRSAGFRSSADKSKPKLKWASRPFNRRKKP